jgi:CRP/FNR family transcriptional regulator, nitrogen oxide reductase regulator
VTTTNLHAIKTAIGRNHHLSLLDSTAQNALALHARLSHFDKDDVIYREAEPAKEVWAVVEGQVKVAKITSKGHELMIEIVLRHELFGAVFYAECPTYPCSAIAMEKTTVLHFPIAEMHRHMDKSARLQKAILADTCRRLCHAQHMRGLAVEDVPHRIGCSLLYLHDRFGDEIPHTRNTLAELAGTTVETALRITGELSRQGILETKRGSITILSREKLEAFAHKR